MRHAKGPILCLFCNAQNFSLRKLWKKVVLVNKTFFGHVLSLSLPLCSVDMQKWTILTGKNYILKKKKNWIRKRKNKIQNCNRKNSNFKKATFMYRIVHATWCKKRTTDNRRQPSTFYQAQCETVHQITKQNLFWKRIKTYERRTKKRRLLSQTYEIEVTFKEIYRL